MSEISVRLKHKIETAKEVEVDEAISSRKRWRLCANVFEIISNISGFAGTVIGIAASIYITQNQNLMYATNVSQALWATAKTMSIWCGKKFADQAALINSTVDSIKSGKMPDLTITQSSDFPQSKIGVRLSNVDYKE